VAGIGSRTVMEVAILTLLPGAIAFAAAMDLFTMTIPNRISALMVIAFFPLAASAGLGAWDVAWHLAAGLLMLGMGVGLFAAGWFGGGDAKLMAAIGLWVGMESLFAYMFYVALAGGMLATLFSMVRSMPLPRAFLGEAWALRLHRPDVGIPYGIALAAGALLVYPQTIWFACLAH
jgi:prepilin peptidase CpaA